MRKSNKSGKKRKFSFLSLFKSKLLWGIIIGILIYIISNHAVHYTSTDSFCESCHIHPQATQSWKLSTHYDNSGGIYVHCVECHLPPSGFPYLKEKAITGIRDVYGKIFKDPEQINWEQKSTLEHAVKIVYNESCIHCHQNLFPLGLSKKGEDAHLYYNQKQNELTCINCHLHVGHYSEKEQAQTFSVKSEQQREVYKKPAQVSEFENYTEYIPNSTIDFEMVAIPGGTFVIGSSSDEPFRNADEGPQTQIDLSPFWMGKTEVSWDEYEAFYRQTATEGRTDTRVVSKSSSDVDAISGPTPPYGSPDQNWGRGKRPAITMTYYSAEKYCQWLSQVTGKKYRLPTEAEWEYACRAGSTTPYFFKGDPKSFSRLPFMKRLFGPDTSVINTYSIYAENSFAKTSEPSQVAPNPFGLLNMPGNVREFCSDWYDKDYYKKLSKKQPNVNPAGPASGKEHVVRGGSFKSDASELRSAARDYTRHDAWMITDPQMPKSLWWYSDCNDVGFRIVCEYNSK